VTNAHRRGDVLGMIDCVNTATAPRPIGPRVRRTSMNADEARVSIPNATSAVIPREKVCDYLLSRVHRVGRHKAMFFAWLGFSLEHWRVLEACLRLQARNGEVVEQQPTEYGRKYVVRGELEGPNGRSARLVSVWIIRTGEAVPRFVTAYRGESTWRSRR